MYVDRHSPFILSDGRPDGRLGIHLEPQNDQMVVQAGVIYDTGRKFPVFFRHKEEMAEETLGF